MARSARGGAGVFVKMLLAFPRPGKRLPGSLKQSIGLGMLALRDGNDAEGAAGLRKGGNDAGFAENKPLAAQAKGRARPFGQQTTAQQAVSGKNGQKGPLFQIADAVAGIESLSQRFVEQTLPEKQRRRILVRGGGDRRSFRADAGRRVQVRCLERSADQRQLSAIALQSLQFSFQLLVQHFPREHGGKDIHEIRRLRQAGLTVAPHIGTDVRQGNIQIFPHFLGQRERAPAAERKTSAKFAPAFERQAADAPHDENILRCRRGLILLHEQTQRPQFARQQFKVGVS